MSGCKKIIGNRDELIEEGEKILEKYPPVSNLAVKKIGNVLFASWKANQPGTIKFKWVDLSSDQSGTAGVSGFCKETDLLTGKAAIKVPKTDELRLIAVVGSWISQPVDLSRSDEKSFEIYSNRDDLTKKLGPISGIEEVNDNVRIYFTDRGKNSNGPYATFYTESSDLAQWSTPKKIVIKGHPKKGSEYFAHDASTMNVFYHEGWKGVSKAGTWILLFDSPDGIVFHFIGYAYQKKGGEGLPQPFFREGRYHMYDRFRFPDKDGIAVRGITYTSHDRWEKNWPDVPKRIADPRDSFDWNGHFKPDFYTAGIGKEVAFPAIFWKDDRRVPERRPNRITGPLHPVKAEVDGEKIRIVSEESPVPLGPHLRVWNSKWATSRQKEVGILQAFPKIIRKNGKEYIFYFYRDDTHYERREDRKALNGIFFNKYQI